MSPPEMTTISSEKSSDSSAALIVIIVLLVLGLGKVNQNRVNEKQTLTEKNDNYSQHLY